MTQIPFRQGRLMRPASLVRLTGVAALAATVLLAGCGERRTQGAGEPAVKVNKQEIPAQQIDAVLQQQRNLRPEQTEAARRQILERLIDQQLALQKAEASKLDRDPRVLQMLEAARREVIARAYVERVGEGAVKPSAEDVKKYYDDKPQLFSQRRVYSIQEIAVEARPDQVEELRAKLTAAKNISEFVEFLKSAGYRFAGNQAVRAAEQLPFNTLEAISKLQDGQALLIPTQQGVQAVVLAGSRLQPVTEEQARPAIEQYLLNERRRKLVEDDIKALRSAATIEYVGVYAAAAAASGAAGAGAASAASAASTK